MAKVIITADIHYGVPGKLEDITYALKTMREYAKDHEIDTILVLGDLFHDRRFIEIDVLNASYDFFSHCKNEYNQRWMVFPGNHDMFLRHSWRINSLRQLSDVMTVIEDASLLEIEDQRFFVLPFVTLESSYMALLNKINSMATENDILLTHIGTAGATLNSCFMLKDWGLVHFNDTAFKRVYTGHFHIPQCIDDKVYYPGSPIPFKFDEGDVSHGFYVLDLSSLEHEFVDIWEAGSKYLPGAVSPPKYCNILDSQISELTEEDVRNNKYRIAMDTSVSDSKKNEIRDHLQKMGVSSVSYMELKADTPSIKQVESETMSSDVFNTYLEDNKKSLKDLDLNLLMELHASIKLAGDELYALDAED